MKNLALTKLITPIVLSLVACLAFADMSLDQAKSEGLVGEDATGYIAAVGKANAEVQSLVSNVNSMREKQYDRIARSNNIERSAVEKLAARKAIEKTRPGQYIRLPGGTWQKK